MHTVNRHRSCGFTLVELAITLFVLTVLAAFLLVPLSGREEIRNRHETRARLAEIREALIGFATIHGRLPCPTHQANPAASDYGLEDTACGQASEGYLPWRTLGLPQIDAWGSVRQNAADAWLGYWRYRVAPDFANPANPRISITTTASLDLDIHDAVTGNSLVASNLIVAIVYSTGPDRAANGQNASYEPGNAIYDYGEPTTGFDDQLDWLSRPLLLARLAAAGALP
ncbi:MAG: prepilin-type N-terminal cleavage/methylation domain-containing protein [Rhodocyclaceae bacterium]|nr:prepilin-type N-terminal cleavage/methylation domain-containing protein [Rhodocyclaceae bacterium]